MFDTYHFDNNKMEMTIDLEGLSLENWFEKYEGNNVTDKAGEIWGFWMNHQYGYNPISFFDFKHLIETKRILVRR